MHNHFPLFQIFTMTDEANKEKMLISHFSFLLLPQPLLPLGKKVEEKLGEKAPEKE